MNALRYKRGWYGESYRHYLAAKGFTSKRFFAGKGNFSNTPQQRELHSLWAQNLTNDQIAEARPDLIPYMGKRPYEKIADGSQVSQSLARQPYMPVRQQPFQPTPLEFEEETVPMAPVEPMYAQETLPGQGIGEGVVDYDGVSTPGSPPEPPEGIDNFEIV